MDLYGNAIALAIRSVDSIQYYSNLGGEWNSLSSEQVPTAMLPTLVYTAIMPLKDIFVDAFRNTS